LWIENLAGGADTMRHERKGVERNQTEWNIDGVAVTDMAATGTSTFYYDFDSFDELQVTTGGSDPSVRTPGVHLNMVTKRGTNELVGSGRFFMTDKDYQADAAIPAEAESYLTAGGISINHIDDYGLEVGGPVMRDKLWAWSAISSNRIENFSAGAAVLQKTRLKNYNAKINYQLLNNNNAEIFYMWSDKTVAGRGLGARRRTIEVAQNQTGPGSLLKTKTRTSSLRASTSPPTSPPSRAATSSIRSADNLVRVVSALFTAKNTKRREVAAHECFRLAGPTGLEPATSGVTGRRSQYEECSTGGSVMH
jgi:hypothetical protein